MAQSLTKEYHVWSTQTNGHLTYAPIGKKIKNRLEQLLREHFEDRFYLEIETPLILPKEVWKRSGHWDRFEDPIIKYMDKDDHVKIKRLDHVLEEMGKSLSEMTPGEVYDLLKNSPVKYVLPDNRQDYQVETKSLMMKTLSGYNEVGLRPETATATYNNYSEIWNYCNKQFPIRVYQIGKSFRNEVNARGTLLRTREFTQAEFHYISDGKDLSAEYRDMLDGTFLLFLNLGIPRDRLRLRQHANDEKAFYALDAWDIEVDLRDRGWTEIAGIHDRGHHDLRHISETPHVLEIAIGIDRLFYAIVDTQLEIRSKKQGKSVLRLVEKLAPYEYSIAVLAWNKPELISMAQKIYTTLGPRRALFHKNVSVGKAYYQSALMGIKRCITIDYQTLEDNTVTIRDRDTTEQTRIDIEKIL